MTHVFRGAPSTGAIPYQPRPDSAWRVKLAFRVDFDNEGHVEGEGFLLDLAEATVSGQGAADMLVSSMNLLRAGTVTIFSMELVRRGQHDD
ncbi:hypothetical protein [Massilia sp. ST3]|uniref:hypothetical protein n=1 Tax=Massilia sp. ST3 TaxID=2824903 RepID=UPI001B83CFE5|nr:hypothetical protein [Massilia sp. ST3]MBQ5950473.1 hypothetical protein [Massilia sp. ST3]